MPCSANKWVFRLSIQVWIFRFRYCMQGWVMRSVFMFGYSCSGSEFWSGIEVQVLHDQAWLFIIFTLTHVTHNLVAIPPSHLSIPLVVTCTSNYYIFFWIFEWRVGFMVMGVTLSQIVKMANLPLQTLLIKFPKNKYSELTILLL